MRARRSSNSWSAPSKAPLPAEAGTALAAVAGLDPGIIVIGEQIDLGLRNPAHHATQVKTLSELALPDYDEYFAALRLACADETVYAAFRAATDVLVEGSRGCFARCDFCGLNRVWQGFRKHSADQVVRGTVALTRKYRTSQVFFVDNVCDTWAEEYARMLVQGGIRQRSFMDCVPITPSRSGPCWRWPASRTSKSASRPSRRPC